MNELFLPPAPNWYQFNTFDCAPDNTVVYGSLGHIFIMNPRDPSEPAVIERIDRAHHEKISGVCINHASWGDPEKLVASIGDDRMVRLWDLDTLSLKMYHKEHTKSKELLVGVSLVGDRVVTVTDKGTIVIWRMSTNVATKLPDIFQQKVRVQCMSSCPHATFLTAFGLNGGLVVIADLAKKRVMYRMRGNDHDITSLSWCPVPINIYKTEAGLEIENILKKKIGRKKSEGTEEGDEKNEEISLEKSQSGTEDNDEIADNLIEKLSGADLAEKISEDNLEEKISEDNLEEKNSEDNLVDKVGDLKISDDKDELDVDIPEYNMDDRKTETYKKVDSKNPWGNIEFKDPDIDSSKDSNDSQKSDFLQECRSLRSMIGLGKEKKTLPAEESEENMLDDSENLPQDRSARIILKPKRVNVLETKENTAENLNEAQENPEISAASEFETLQEKIENIIEENKTDDDKTDSKLEIVEQETENLEPTDDITETSNDEVSAKRFISETSDKEYLLASAGRDGTVHVWRALTDGRMQIFFPTPVKQKRGQGRDNYRTKWIAVCWAKPDILIVSTLTNRLYCWNLLPNIKPNKNVTKQLLFDPRLIHQDHSAQIFTISVPFKIYSEVERTESWSSLEDFFIWTTSKDKWILCTTIGTQRKTVASYPCLNSGATSMAVSPIDPTKLALGLYDCSVRIWDLSVPQTQVISMTKINDNFTDKILTLDWHPVKENCLAYGTADGKVAQFLTNNKGRVIFHPYHRNAVYKIQWGPLPEKEGEYALYSCSFGELIYHDGTDPNAEPNKVNLDHCQTFAWNANYSILAVGLKDGSVKLMSKDFSVYETLYMQKKAVQCLSWHPESTVSDTGTSPFANFLAVASNEPNILVYNCRSVKEMGDSYKKSTIVAVLEGHNASVKYLAWCPQVGGRLVSGSEDNIIIVWNVYTKTILSTYKLAGRDAVGCITWSPVDADLIIIGGKDCSIKIFRITKNPPVVYETDKKEKKKSSLKSLIDTDDVESNSSSPQIDKIRKINVLPAITRMQNPEFVDAIGTCRKIIEMSKETSKKTEEDESEIDSSDEENMEVESSGERKIAVEQLFGGPKDMMNILNYEQQNHVVKHQWDQTHYISLWKGNLSDSIEKALKSGIVEPWIINMAPMVSHELWSKLCLMYAEKLTEEGRGLEASSYFTACHQIHKAIHALCNSKLYREALALAKCRLPSDEQLIESIYEQWAAFSTINGNYEIAAQCYIKLRRYSDAGILLNKRAEPDKLELALDLAKLSSNHDLEVAVNAKLELLKQQKEEIQEPIDPAEDIEENHPIIKISQSRFEAFMTKLESEETVSEKNEDDEHEDV